MALIGRVHWRDVPWGWFASALLLTAVGVAFVASACYAPTEPYGLGREARMQIVWWGVAVLGCLVAMHVPLSGWKQLAIPVFVACILLELFMMAAAGTALVPRIKGQANWIALGPLRLQPVEFIKLGALLMCARLVAAQSFDARRLMHCAAALATAAFPALLVAREDLGSAIVFPFMVLGILVVAGMRWSYFAATLLLMGACVAAVVVVLPKEGPKAYQYKRIQAWMHPDEYALTEGYQTMRSMRSIGSGQWLGKGYGNGDQNRLGWLPEKHTDLIFAVVGEEIGFVGSGAVLGAVPALRVVGPARRGAGPRPVRALPDHRVRVPAHRPGLDQPRRRHGPDAGDRRDRCRSSATAARACSPATSAWAAAWRRPRRAATDGADLAEGIALRLGGSRKRPLVRARSGRGASAG